MVLVSGATGLLGSHLLYHLAKDGKRIRALYHNKKSIGKTEQIFSYYSDSNEDLMAKVEWVEADINDICRLEEVMNGIDEVFHCAAVVSFNKRDHNRMMRTNVDGTVNMLEAAKSNDVKKFCHVSSIASFGKPEKKGLTIDESQQREENEESSVYSMSKYYAELEVWRAIEEGLNAVIINPSTIIGSGSWDSGSSALFRRVYEGLSYYTEGVNGFVDVRDVVKVMRSLMDQNIFKQQFIVVGENQSFKYIISSIAKNLNLQPPKFKANRILSELVWRLEKMRCAITKNDPVITKESASIALDKQHYSNEKIKKALGIEFIPIGQSIEDASKSFLS